MENNTILKVIDSKINDYDKMLSEVMESENPDEKLAGKYRYYVMCLTELRREFFFKEHAIFELLYASGIRVSELVNIVEKDIDFKEMTIRVLGKGSKERIVFFGEYAKEALLNYLKYRDELNIKNNNRS